MKASCFLLLRWLIFAIWCAVVRSAVPSFAKGAWNATSGTWLRSSLSSGPPDGATFGGVGSKSFSGVFGSMVNWSGDDGGGTGKGGVGCRPILGGGVKGPGPPGPGPGKEGAVGIGVPGGWSENPPGVGAPRGRPSGAGPPLPPGGWALML